MEVSTHLGTQVVGFQVVPSKPQGDAGLDGMSHGGERGYCCYGPEHDSFKTIKTLVNAIVKKFTSDLRRLFELDIEKKTLVRKTNKELSTILPAGCKLKQIYLVVNWFESHRVLGPILTAVAEYKKVSECRYVDPDATVVVIGPEELANLYSVDSSSLYRVQQRVFVSKVKLTAQSVVIDNPKEFESKIQVLREIRPDMVAAIEAWSEQLLNNWRMALAFEIELDNTLPMLHQSLEDCRRQIVVRVSELMMSAAEPWSQLGNAHDIALEILNREFGKQHSVLLPDVSSGEIARLIGECPVGWKKPGTNA